MHFSITDAHKQVDERFTFPLFFTDHMVLQAEKPVRFWGQYPVDGGLAVEAYVGDERVFRVFGDVREGRFDVTLPATPHGGPYELRVVAEHGGCWEFTDVLFGEVFLCGGQSNMQLEVGQCYGKTMDVLRYQKEIDEAADPLLRSFRVDSRCKRSPSAQLDGLEMECWKETTPQNVRRFSAVSYFFSREVRRVRQVPVGFIHCCESGTQIQCWMPAEEFDTLGMDDVDKALLAFDGKACSYSPSIWYNAKIHPLLPMTVRGVLWYQGEGNPAGIMTPKGTIVHGYKPYSHYLKLLIEGWRRAFEQPDMPFAVVQLPRFTPETEAVWFFSREEDKRVCSLVDNVVYSVNIDNGLYREAVAPGDGYNEGHGIHPYRKKEVGERLAKVFLHTFFGEAGLCSGPVLERAVLEDRATELTYSNVGDGLCLVGDPAGFEMAGDDGVFFAAVPQLIDDCRVRLICNEVKDPVWVRYGFSNNSSLITKPLLECDQSVCLYNTQNGEAAFPAEQFFVSLR